MKTILSNFLTILIIFISFDAFSQTESNIVITEIMYNQPGDDSLEYIELYNKSNATINLAGYKFTSGINYTFPAFNLAANGYVVLSKYPEFLNSFFEITSIGWTDGSLDNNGEKIVLKTPSGTIADSVEYEDGGPWPKDPNGKGPSLALCDPNADNSLGYTWKSSTELQGNFPSGTGNFIFGNPGTSSSCNASLDVYPPRVKNVFAESPTKVLLKFDEPVQLNAAQNIANYAGIGNITSAMRTPSMDSVKLTLATPLTLGRVYTLTITNMADTAGNIITAPKTEEVAFNNTIAPLVITEILYDHPGQDTLEFIELLNNGTLPVQVGGYKFTSGIEFRFPSMVIEPGAYVLVVQNLEVFNSFFKTGATLQYAGSFSNTGEKIKLENTSNDIIDSLTYFNSWQPLTLGASLVMCDANTDNSYRYNWGASGDSQGNFQGSPIWASPGKVQGSCSPLAVFGNLIDKSLITLYPNPTKGKFEISTPFTSRNIKTEVIDAIGKVIYTHIDSQQNIFVDLANVENKGLHLVHITDLTTNTSATIKVVLE